MSEKNKSLTKESKQVLCELGYYYINNKDYDKAMAIFNSLIIIDDQLPFRYGLANLFFAKADYDKAIEICEDILDDYPEDITAKLIMAENLIFADRDRKANDILDRVLSTDLDDDSRNLALNLKKSIQQGLSGFAARSGK